MKILTGKIKEEFDRDLYWTRIVFLSDDESKKSQVLAVASQEFLEDFYKLSGNQKLSQEHFDQWLKSIIEKWSVLKDEIFNQDIHYDVYFNTKEGETNGLNFLISKVS